MSKRGADRQITQDTVDQEDEPEDAGQFEKASQSELQGRVFKKARRTHTSHVTSTDQSDSRQGLFSGIRLTGSLTQQNGLLSNSKPLLQFPPSSTSTLLTSTNTLSTQSTIKPSFLTELRNLNTSVNDWIGKHVRENPYVDLTPIFRDYEHHLKELDHKYQTDQSKTIIIGGGGSEVVASATDDVKNENIGHVPNEGEGDSEVGGEMVEGGGEECGEEGEDSERGQVMEDESSKSDQIPAADEEEEDMAVFSVRAKLFFKRSTEKEFTELGIGQMRVLPGNKEGVNVIMRNDTTLAKVLLNVRVTESIPLSSNKNHVLMVCAPNPPLEKKSDDGEIGPVTYLIRVKTVTMATELMHALRAKTD